MYRSGVKPWKSSSWRPEEKHIHDEKQPEPSETKDVSVKEDSV